MNTETLKGLESLNQLALTEEQKAEALRFFDERAQEWARMDALDTAETEVMVHVMPMENILRDDVAEKLFTRDELQEGAPETMDGCWQVPRLVG